MTVNTFSSGINTSFTSELNENFAETRHKVTRSYLNSAANTSSTTFQDFLTVATPAATKNNQVVFLDAIGWCYRTDTDAMEWQIYDATDAAVVAAGAPGDYLSGDGTTRRGVGFLQGTVTIASSGTTKSIKIQYRRTGGTNNDSVGLDGAKITCMLVES